MIIELYGLPGAGKTTIIKKYTGGKATSVSGKKGIKKYFNKVIKMVAVHMPDSVWYKHQMASLLKPYVKMKYINMPQKRILNNIALVAFGYKHIRSTIYMDEGLTHRIISMAVNYGLSDGDVFRCMDFYKSVMINVKCCYLEVPLDECVRSIEQRNRHECRMDELDEEVLRKYLADYEYYCKIVCKRYGHRIITRENYECEVK